MTCRRAVLAPLTMLLLAPVLAAAGDGAAESYARGARIYERCLACHALEVDRTGPHHCGLVGRRAGSVAGFPYSPALRRAKFRWTEANLDRFLAAPLAFLPGTAMGYDGIKDDGERRDLIVYLREASREARCQEMPPTPPPPGN